MIKRILMVTGSVVTLLIFILLLRTFLIRPIEYDSVSGINLPAINETLSAIVLSRAIKYKTIAEREKQKMPHAEFSSFRTFLQTTFPLVHKKLKRELVDGHTMLFYWEGKKPGLAPVILMGHYDVVPISSETRKNWEVPPFEGIIKDGYIWGRGAIDDKIGVIGQLSAVESLLSGGFQPERPVYLAFGHDEEVLGNGAKAVVQLLKARKVKPLFVLDEGGSVLTGSVPGIKKPVALVGTAEKGYLTLKLKSKGVGGHSSMPPENTAVGIVAKAISRLEENQQPKRVDGALKDFFRHTGPHMPFVLRMAVSNLWLLQPVVMGQLASSKAGAASVRTTTAATVITGGVKENVLPDTAQALVNFRLLPGDSPEIVIARVKKTIGDTRVEIEEVQVTPASPVSPSDSDSFRQIGKTIRTVFPDAIVSPFLMIGATDSRRFSELTPNVYRFLPVRLESLDLDRMHGVNERVSVKNFAESIRFYQLLLGQQ